MGFEAPHSASRSHDWNTYVINSNAFTGFDQARHVLWCYETRAHVYRTLEINPLMADGNVAFLHVDNARCDRSVITAFDARGDHRGADTIYNDEARGLEPMSDFVLNPTTSQITPAADSELSQRDEDGWIIDMALLRDYDITADRRATQRTMTLALLQDMIVDGDARALLFGSDLKGSDATRRPN